MVGYTRTKQTDMLCWLVSVVLFVCAATGVSAFTVSTSTPSVKVNENQGGDLICSYSADFGSSARLEWKFQDLTGTQTYVYFDGKLTTPYADRVSLYGGSNLRFTKMTRRDTGTYDCEVSGNEKFGKASVQVTVLVPPSPPLCRVPARVTTGTKALLLCSDVDGSPPPTYKWYKNGTPLPVDPGSMPAFQNFTYRLNTKNGNLDFPSATKMDSGQYYCEASNELGSQSCKAIAMDVRDLNTGGIAAGIIVALLLLVLLGVAIWYAHKKGYLPQKSKSKSKPNVVYQPSPLRSGDDGDGEFKPKSSFLV
ncbi:Junctional adhesion molecule A [Channa argus]|uniref:Junctional adhesion molecule A n=1 Tax=Channa argus TaxID=215402 RepID=A0A6G1QUR8_CHAAH|nr:Junctional adhesion molecule A [Channa argus]KAK2881817.1 hypothetical protein Q8A73_022327 [Channa argus]